MTVQGESLTHHIRQMNINPAIIVGSHQQDYVRRAINGSEIVEYSIFGNPLDVEAPGRTVKIGWNESDTIYAYNHDNYQATFIRSVFDRLDRLLSIDFVEGDTTGNSDINIHRSRYNSWYDDRGNLINNDPSNGWGGGSAHYDYDNVDISWKDYYRNDPFTDSEKMSIVHEIGHALGLMDLAYDSAWNTYDSIMSYNHPRESPIQTWFTDADIKAMQSIWGVETSENPILTGKKAVLANGTEDTQYTFAKSILLQGFTDIDSTILSIDSVRSSNGTLSDNGNGTFTLTPPKDFSGTIALSYVVADGDGGSLVASNSIYFNDLPDGIRREGNAKNNKLKGGYGDDTLVGYGGSDKIIGKKGDDVIDAGIHGSRADKVRGGSGSDTFVIREGYWTDIKDFNVVEDILDLNGLTNGLEWDYQDGKTYIRGDDGKEVARFRGYKNLDQANFI